VFDKAGYFLYELHEAPVVTRGADVQWPTTLHDAIRDYRARAYPPDW